MLDYNSWFKKELTRYLICAVGYDLSINFRDEICFFFEENYDVDITIDKLRPTVDNKWVKQPLQLMIMCKEELYSRLAKAFDKFSFDYNNSKVDMEQINDNTGVISNVVVEHCYTPHAVLQHNLPIGTDNYTMLTISGLIKYKN